MAPTKRKVNRPWLYPVIAGGAFASAIIAAIGMMI